MKKINILINDEVVHFIMFADEMNDHGNNVYRVMSSNPKVHLVDYFRDVPQLGEKYTGDNATKDFVLGEMYDITVFFIFTINDIVEHIMPVQYTENNEILVAALASDPVLMKEES